MNAHKQIRDRLEYFCMTNQIPNIIFHGSSDAGKTALVHDWLSVIYKNDKLQIKKNVMFVNCSHGKGIKFIREELKFFAKTNLQTNSGVRFKSIVLFNADDLTTDAQSALRRLIELFSFNTRFFIVVEHKHKLLNPILSRFCEIYVPRISNDRPRISDDVSLAISRVLKSDISHVCVCADLYDLGISCLDLVAYIQSSDKWTDGEKANIAMLYDKVKPEFRCEKLLMLYLLDFAETRPGFDLHGISFW
jgi:hypothetical protein